MHEAALAQAALPAPTVVLGMPLRPFSIGHELALIREGNPLAETLTDSQSIVDRAALAQAALICSETWAGIRSLHKDPWLPLKLLIWKLRTRNADQVEEVRAFNAYRNAGSLEFKVSDMRQAGQPPRQPGAPFLLRLQQFLVVTMRLSEEQAWNYPYGLAKMQWSAFWEGEGGLALYNDHDAEFDRYVAEQEALLAHATNKLTHGED